MERGIDVIFTMLIACVQLHLLVVLISPSELRTESPGADSHKQSESHSTEILPREPRAETLGPPARCGDGVEQGGCQVPLVSSNGSSGDI